MTNAPVTPALQQSDDRLLAPHVAVRDAVTAEVNRLQHVQGSTQLSAAAKQTLARLRRLPADSPTAQGAWALTLGVVPEHLLGHGDDATAAERAVHAALVLFAVHAQSARGVVHVEGRRLGRAMVDLGVLDEPAVRARFMTLGTAATWRQQIYHLRGLVSLMRGAGVALDYGLLAVDLYQLQSPQGRDAVRLRWGRDLYRIYAKPADPQPDSTNPTPPTTPTEQES